MTRIRELGLSYKTPPTLSEEKAQVPRPYLKVVVELLDNYLDVVDAGQHVCPRKHSPKQVALEARQYLPYSDLPVSTVGLY